MMSVAEKADAAGGVTFEPGGRNLWGGAARSTRHIGRSR